MSPLVLGHVLLVAEEGVLVRLGLQLCLLKARNRLNLKSHLEWCVGPERRRIQEEGADWINGNKRDIKQFNFLCPSSYFHVGLFKRKSKRFMVWTFGLERLPLLCLHLWCHPWTSDGRRGRHARVWTSALVRLR